MSLRKIGTLLWVLVLLYGAWYIYQNGSWGNNDKPVAELREGFDGRAFAEDLPWKHLPHMKPFRLTERSGEKFESSSLAGKPYVVSFFFSRCPTTCRDQNTQIGRLANRYKDSDATFLGLTVDAEYDSPEVLREYADSFQVSSEKWLFLTGQQFRIDQISSHQFNAAVVKGEHHTSDLFLIDRWGRYRDRFSWQDPREMERFDEVMQQVLAETEPPVEEKIKTRNVLASLTHAQRLQATSTIPWLLDFQLTDQDGNDFNSRDLTGTVWVASFFFSRCGTICPRQNEFLAELQPELWGRNAKLVSITTDPDFDKPAVLRPYARDLNASPGNWIFLTGDKTYVDRIGSEFLGLSSHGEHHSTRLAVIDRWGNKRGDFAWQNEAEVKKMLDMIDQLNKEKQPPASFSVFQGQP